MQRYPGCNSNLLLNPAPQCCDLQNPFGDAKPREAVLAERTGKDEATVVKEDANTYDIHLKLNSTQFAEKMARQHEIDDLKAVLASGDGDQEPQELEVRLMSLSVVYPC